MNKSKKQLSLLISIFVVTLVISLAVHIPAGWLLQTNSVKQALQSNGLELNGVTGTVLIGQAKLNYQGHNAGQVEWQLQPLELVMLNASTKLTWRYQTSAVNAQLQVNFLAPNEVSLQDAKGTLMAADVSQLAAPYVSQYAAFIKGAEGKLRLTSLATVFDTHSQWFNEFSLTAQADDLALMGNQFPTLDITGQQLETAGEVQFAVTGGKEGAWSLQVNASLLPGFKQQGELDLKAVSETQLPDWAFTLRKRSAKHYQLNF